MARASKKSLQAVPKGPAALSGLTPADLERRRFDARLVSSALQFKTDADDTPDDKGLPALADKHFGWLRDEIRPRAARARVPESEAVLSSMMTVAECVAAEAMLGGFIGLWFGQVHSKGTVQLVPHKPGQPIRYEKGREALDAQLGQLWIVDHYRLTGAGIERVSVPYLSTVPRCMAYVIAVLMENRWGLADRVKVCPFRPDPQEGFHVFLNFRLREDGNLLDGAGMKYCCAQHQNADSQRRHRQAKARKHK